jgi:hypothetical protein
LVIRAVDQDAADAGRAHLAECDFLRPIHPDIKPCSEEPGKAQGR